MRYILYRTTCIVNNKFYIGKHQTEDINDGYLGSGLRLRLAIKKYGAENFIKEIIGEYNTAEELNKAECLLITEEILNDKNCYNLALGGQGGFLGESTREKGKRLWTDERRKKQSEIAKNTVKSEKWLISNKNKLHSWEKMDESQKEKQKISMSNSIKDLWKSPEHRKKMKVVRSKTPTSDSFKYATRGRSWVCNSNGKRRLVKPEEIEMLIKLGWAKGKTPPKTNIESIDCKS